MSDSKNQVTVQTSEPTATASPLPRDTSVAVVQSLSADSEHAAPADVVDEGKKGFFAYFKTKEFYITLALGWV